MKNLCTGVLPVLLFAVIAPAAERLKLPVDTGTLEYLTNSRSASIVAWEHPQYAPEPAAEWVQQAVRVAFEVDADGQVRDVRALGGADRFAEAAIAAVSRWKFRPEISDGKPTLASKEVRVKFSPNGPPKRRPNDELFCPYALENPEPAPPGEPENSDVIYPAALLPRRLSGEVELLMSVNEEGRVDGVKILRATHPDFLNAAVQTVAGWQLRPARIGKVPQRGQKGIVLSFYPVDEEGRTRRAEWLECNGIHLRDNPAAPTTAWFDHTPTATAMVDPVYPCNLLQAGTRGAARVDFGVDFEGRVVNVSVAEATAPEFGEAVAAAMAAWQFEPMQRENHPVGPRFSITWRFKEPAADGVEQRLLENLGTEREAVDARQLDRPLFPLFTRLPDYPAARLDAKEPGEARIEVVIDREGRVRLPHIRHASQPEFGRAAATAVSQWLFETPRKGGEPVDVRVLIPIQFKPPEPAL
jgi:TonB family protein